MSAEAPDSGQKPRKHVISRDRSRRTASIVGAIVVVLAIYFVLAVDRGSAMISQGTVIGILLGVGILILPFVGAWIVLAEL